MYYYFFTVLILHASIHFIARKNYIWSAHIIFRMSKITSLRSFVITKQYEKQFSREEWEQSGKYINISWFFIKSSLQ